MKDEGRRLFARLVSLVPRAKYKWYSSCMTKMLGRRITVGVLRRAAAVLRFSKHKMVVLYSECAQTPAKQKRHIARERTDASASRPHESAPARRTRARIRARMRETGNGAGWRSSLQLSLIFTYLRVHA